MQPWMQIYDPLGNLWLSSLVAALPIIFFFVALAVLRMKGHVAGTITVAISLAVAIFFYKMPVEMALASAGYGFLYGLWPIAWIIIGAVFLYKITVKTGQFDVIRASVVSITDDQRLQMLLVGFSFGAFLEGAAGFGAPVAITAALLVGAFVERMRFSAMLIFISLWTLLVYAPVAHWVWEPGGWLAQMGALDFAGGSVVHVNAGIAGLVCAWFLGRRTGYGREPFEPYNLGLTMAGAGMLWVGWFGFNAGSAVAADGRAGLAMAVTHLAAAAGALSWMLGEWVVRGRPSLLGLCSGLVAGLVAITPAAGFVTLRSAVVIGVVAARASAVVAQVQAGAHELSVRGAAGRLKRTAAR